MIKEKERIVNINKILEKGRFEENRDVPIVGIKKQKQKIQDCSSDLA